ncbi:MAG: hypothetical protein GF365_02290 [Candidatus Buchananbacteria bacterium]|nr:hypothetical protein [Candidatus Buchananbacteria bacterium]
MKKLREIIHGPDRLELLIQGLALGKSIWFDIGNEHEAVRLWVKINKIEVINHVSGDWKVFAKLLRAQTFDQIQHSYWWVDAQGNKQPLSKALAEIIDKLKLREEEVEQMIYDKYYPEMYPVNLQLLYYLGHYPENDRGKIIRIEWQGNKKGRRKNGPD